MDRNDFYQPDAGWEQLESTEREAFEMGSSYVSNTGGGDFQPAPEGVHIAICDLVANIGVQETSFGPKNQHVIRWQIPSERTEDDRPQIIYNTYTSSLNEKSNLRHHLEAWRGRAFTEAELERFDLANILGKPCQLQIVHREKGGKTYANIGSIMSLPKGAAPPTLEGEAVLYDATHAPDTLDKLPAWIQKKLGHEPSEADPPPRTEAAEFADEIPF